MNISEVKANVESSIGYLLTKVQDDKLSMCNDLGSFFCSVDNFDDLAIIKRKFENGNESINIPFSSYDPCVQMIFSLDGQSAFNDTANPFLLSPASHCINFFKRFECRNLLDANVRQHDITFRLGTKFYTDLIASNLCCAEGRLPEMILHQQEFNTINQHIPADAGILGILKNIIDCPFTGNMRSLFVREHVRALFILQLLHFNPIVTGKKIQCDGKFNKRDKETLHAVKKYIDDHFLDPASLETLSKHFGLNEFKLKHGFKVLFDTSPIRYLQCKRLEYSLLLLRETDIPIKKIADELGYAHAANFTTAFTRAFGNSPLHYRTGRVKHI